MQEDCNRDVASAYNSNRYERLVMAMCFALLALLHSNVSVMLHNLHRSFVTDYVYLFTG